MSTWERLCRKPSMNVDRKEKHDIGRDVLAIYRELQDSPRPLAAKELAANIYLSNHQIEHRLDSLILNSHVRRREDGPDGRVSYYEPMDRVHHCNGEYWEPKAVRRP